MHAIIFSMATSQYYLVFLVPTVNTARTRYLLCPQCGQLDLSYTDAA